MSAYFLMPDRTTRFLKIVERVGNGKKVKSSLSKGENVSEFLESASKLVCVEEITSCWFLCCWLEERDLYIETVH